MQYLGGQLIVLTVRFSLDVLTVTMVAGMSRVTYFSCSECLLLFLMMIALPPRAVLAG
jgi:hypothetical protein